jgi:outer membrane protein
MMKLKSSELFLLSLLALSGTVRAADLLEVFHVAQVNDPVFAAARAARQAGQEKLPQGRALLMPSINLSANTTFNDQTTNYQAGSPLSASSGNKRYNSNGYGVSLAQPLFRAQNWLAYTEAQLQVEQADAQYKIAEQDLVLRVAQSYFDVLIAQDNVQLVEAQKNAITEQLAQAKRNFEVGTATVTDSLEAQSRFDLILAQEVAAKNNLDVKRSGLQQLISEAPKNLEPLGVGFKLDLPKPVGVEQWVAEAQNNNPQIALALASATLAEKEVSRNQAAHLPTLDLVANYAKSNASGGSLGANDSNNKSIGVQLNVPLFQGGSTSSKSREAEANQERGKQELENARRNVTTQTRQAYLGVESGMAQVQALQQALASSQSLLDASKLGQEVGIRTNLDVLNAQQQLYSTRRDLYQAQYNYLLSQLRLKAAVGGLGEEALSQVNAALR